MLKKKLYVYCFASYQYKLSLTNKKTKIDCKYTFHIFLLFCKELKLKIITFASIGFSSLESDNSFFNQMYFKLDRHLTKHSKYNRRQKMLQSENTLRLLPDATSSNVKPFYAKFRLPFKQTNVACEYCI